MSDEEKLSSSERELEMALRSLRPTPARVIPTAAAYAADRRTFAKRLRFWQVAAAAAIAVAGGAWLTFGRRGELPDRIERQSRDLKPGLAAAIELPVPPATMLAYRQSLARSPAELEALLDLQAKSESARDQITPIGAVTVWNANLRSLPGEM